MSGGWRSGLLLLDWYVDLGFCLRVVLMGCRFMGRMMRKSLRMGRGNDVGYMAFWV